MNERIDLAEVNVLIVDDSRHMRVIIKSIMHALGCRHVREAGDAAAAFKEMQSFPADVVVVDWHMEPLDGLDFVRLIRTAKDSPNPFVPIIMLSAYTEHRRVAEARDAGVNEFLAKPISAAGMARRIVAIINNPRQFISTRKYFGPCRRRKDVGPPRGTPDRRVQSAEVKTLDPKAVQRLAR
jgi:PleD family two-component response regulator